MRLQVTRRSSLPRVCLKKVWSEAAGRSQETIKARSPFTLTKDEGEMTKKGEPPQLVANSEYSTLAELHQPMAPFHVVTCIGGADALLSHQFHFQGKPKGSNCVTLVTTNG